MIGITCGCGWKGGIAESAVNRTLSCAACGRTWFAVAAEQLPQDSGAGDFDVQLVVLKGPARVGQAIIPGGVAEIGIGKLTENPVVLEGNQVSRRHCKLVRLDFGPSRWNLVDLGSRNGVYVNGERITEHELKAGDIVRIGEYELQYDAVADSATQPDATAALAEEPAAAGAGPTCPSCGRQLGRKAKICVHCGVNIETGRPLVLSQGLDENTIHANADSWLRIVSWIVWVTPLPLPIASEAFGTRKPYATWVIALLTILASLTFLVYSWPDPTVRGAKMMLWPRPADRVELTPRQKERLRRLVYKAVEQAREELRGTVPDDQLDKAAIDKVMPILEKATHREDFQWWQLITHAFLHDNSGVINFALHLAGNMLFLLVFASRVNALLGNTATAVGYLLFAVAAGWAHMVMGHPHGPMLGASGAVQGMAGLYLILFPVHRVFCAMWFRIPPLSLRGLARTLQGEGAFWCKVFTLRGFWLLLIYFSYDSLMAWLQQRVGAAGGTAHWAHIGGFTAGAALGLCLLFSRLINCGGADLLSVVLGKYAWPLIGKPTRWQEQADAT